MIEKNLQMTRFFLPPHERLKKARPHLDTSLQENARDPAPAQAPIQPRIPQAPLSITSMAINFANSAVKWTSKGLSKTDEETLKTRIETCQGCEFWNSKGFGGTGRCMKCGCSTWAKLRMATERCPIGKW
jgi:hypothetical protein